MDGEEAATIKNVDISYLCGHFQAMNVLHAICGIKDEHRIRVQNKSYLDRSFKQHSYRFESDDCLDGQLPRNGDCVTVMRANRYCCNYSLNFKVVGVNETVDGVTGPAMA